MVLTASTSKALGPPLASRRANHLLLATAVNSLSRRAQDSGTAADLSHLIRAEDARRKHRQADALRDVEQFRLSPNNPLALAFRPAYAHARFLRAEILYDLHRDQEALRWYDSLSEAYDPIYLPMVHFRKGEILLRRGDKAGAAVEFRRFINLWKNCDFELKPLIDSASATLRQQGG